MIAAWRRPLGRVRRIDKRRGFGRLRIGTIQGLLGRDGVENRTIVPVNAVCYNGSLPQSTSPARSFAKVATLVCLSCKSCGASPKGSPPPIWLPSYPLTAATSYVVAPLFTRCSSSVFPPALPDLIQESDEVYVNAGEQGWMQADPVRPSRRRANKRQGHGAPGPMTARRSRGWWAASAGRSGCGCCATVRLPPYAC